MFYGSYIGFGGGTPAAGGYDVTHSVRCNDDDSPRLTRTMASGTPTKQTIGGWFKRCNTDLTQRVFVGNPPSGGGKGAVWVYFNANNTIQVLLEDEAGNTRLNAATTRVFRDPHAFCHWCLTYDTSISSPTVEFYINNELETMSASHSAAQNDEFGLNANDATLDLFVSSTHSGYCDMYAAEMFCLDGVVVANPAAGGIVEVDDNGVVRPVDLSGLTFGAQGWLLDFANSSALGNDVSGNNNDFTSSGLAANDQVLDTPTDNYCVMSPITGLTDTTLSDGGLAVSSSTDEDYILSSMAIDVADSDGWYFEFEETANNASSQIGVYTMDFIQDDASPGNDPSSYMFELSGGGRQLGSASYQNNATWDSGTNGEIAEDAYGVMAIKGGHIWAGVVADGGGTITWYNGATKAEIEAGTTTNAMTTSALSGYHWISWTHSGTATATGQFNFGQHAFQGSDIPSGLKKISTSQLPAPAIKDGTSAFQSTLYTGNGSSRNIDQTENSTFTPDMVWIKNRDQADEWKVTDIARGVTKAWSPDATAGEDTDTNGLTSFDSDGFGLGSGAAGYNDNTEKFVAYQWLAGGGAGSSNTTGSLNTTSTSVNLAAGFSLSKYTGDGGTDKTIGHGLGVTPAFSIIKRMDTTGTGAVVGTGMAATKAGQFSESDGEVTLTAGIPVHTSSTLITLKNGSSSGANVNASGGEYVCYAWAAINGFSAFGVYTGNGESGDGPLIFTGFAPAWLMIKRIDTADSWHIRDIVRGEAGNPRDEYLAADVTNADRTYNGYLFDFLSNGFKPVGLEPGLTLAAQNADGGKYFYAAFAEHPFGGSGVSPATAR